MVDLVALTATHDAVEAPAVDFDWYVPVTVTWPKRQRLLEPPVYRQISWHSGLLELKFHPHDNDLVEAVLIFPDQVDIEDHALAPAPTDPNPSLIYRLRQKRGAGGRTSFTSPPISTTSACASPRRWSSRGWAPTRSCSASRPTATWCPCAFDGPRRSVVLSCSSPDDPYLQTPPAGGTA